MNSSRPKAVVDPSLKDEPREPIAPAEIPQPPFWGVRTEKSTDFELKTLFEYINPTALFKNQWQLKTASQQDYARLVEEKYKPILAALEEDAIAGGWFDPQVVYGYFPCQSKGNDLIVYAPAPGLRLEDFGTASPSFDGKALTAGGALAKDLPELLRFSFPRQGEGRRLSISDYFLPESSGRADVIALSVVTIGARASEETQRLFERGEYTRYLYLHGLSVETAEALAEFLHRRIRQQLSYRARRLNAYRRPVPSEVSRLALQLWVSGLSAHGGSDEAVCAAAARGKHRCATDLDLLAGAGAEHFGNRGASSWREVLCGVDGNSEPGFHRTRVTARRRVCYTRSASARSFCTAERWQSG